MHTGSYRLVVAANKTEALAREILRSFAVEEFFSVVAGGDSQPRRKSHLDHLLLPLKELGVAPEDSVMIGDSENDIVSGKAAGLADVVCSFGYSKHPIETLGTDRVIDSFEALTGVWEELAALR